MSLVTACPACSTHFFVNTAQLNAHHGDVRCGKCSHVFNAMDRLGEVDATTTSEVAQPTPQPAPLTAAAPDVAPPRLTPSPVAKPAETPGIFGEVKSKKRIAGRRKITWPYYVFALLLLMSGIVQVLYFMRTPLSTQWPELKPFLVSTCSFVGCKVDLPRNIDQLVIDDSDLQEDAEHEDVIRLSTLLINNAPYAQAYPLLELTLTDRNDRPVLRRAFTAAEYLNKGRDVNAGIAPGEELQIKLALTSSDVDVSGYRVYLSYP